MLELVITRGLPGSGKTTWARAWVAKDEQNRARINRDDLRHNLYGRFWPVPEEQVTVAQHAAVRALLIAGVSVVVDDTNLRARVARAYADLAAEHGAAFRVEDLHTPVETCIRWDAARAVRGERAVGEQVIREMHQRFHHRPAITATAAAPVEQYVPDEALPPAWLVDVDGTIALNTGGRSWFDWSRVGEDTLNEAVAELVRGIDYVLMPFGRVLVLSGRDEGCRAETTDWLNRHKVPFDDLLMRPAGDMRRDAIVKLELFQRHIAPNYCVRGVIDDRNQVVDMWRSIGLTCVQVAPGDF